MHFENPNAFWLLIPVLILAVREWLRRQDKRPTIQLSYLKIFNQVKPTLRTRLMNLPFFLKFISIIFLIIALARPQEANTRIKKNIEGIDIIICLDISDSMLIEDMKPLNRLEAAKETIQAFIEKRTSDRIGLVIFAGEAFTQVPPTLDYEVLIQRVKEITTARMARIKDGTALGVAMANAAGRLRDSTAKSRVMIFMTDGENNSGTIDPETGLAVAKGYGIKVYSIGIGKDGPTKIPIYGQDFFGNKVKTYQPFESTVNEELLSRMASETGGKYFRASKENSLVGVFSEIDRLEKTKIDINRFTRYNELYSMYLIIGLIVYLITMLIEKTWLKRVP